MTEKQEEVCKNCWRTKEKHHSYSNYCNFPEFEDDLEWMNRFEPVEVMDELTETCENCGYPKEKHLSDGSCIAHRMLDGTSKKFKAKKFYHFVSGKSGDMRVEETKNHNPSETANMKAKAEGTSTLSDEIKRLKNSQGVQDRYGKVAVINICNHIEENVKNFIKLLKEQIGRSDWWTRLEVKLVIDKLAGDDLICQ